MVVRASSLPGPVVAGLVALFGLSGGATEACAQVVFDGPVKPAAEVAFGKPIGLWGMQGQLSFFREATRDVRGLIQRIPDVALQRPRALTLGAPEISTLQLSGLRAELSGFGLGLDWRAGYMLRGIQDRWAFDRVGPGQQSEIERALPKHNLMLQAGTFWQGALVDATLRAGSATWRPSRTGLGWTDVPARVSFDLGATWGFGRLGRVELRGENLAGAGVGPGWAPPIDRRVTLSFSSRF